MVYIISKKITSMISNSYIYEFKKYVYLEECILYKSDYKSIVLYIKDKYCLFITNTNDFSNKEIQNIYDKQQIYINIKNGKVSHDFLNDYRKLKKCGDYFVIDKINLFKKSEVKIKNILNKFFIGECLDIGCGESLYKNIFLKNDINYLGIDIHKVDNGLNIIESTFENFTTNKKFDFLFFFRSINHFSNTLKILEKAYSLLKENGKIFIVENEAFGEIKFKNQIFEGKKGDFEHYFNYSLTEFKKLVNNDNFSIIEEEEVTKDRANQWYILLEKNENISNKS